MQERGGADDMEYNGSDNVSDILRGNSGVVEEISADTVVGSGDASDKGKPEAKMEGACALHTRPLFGSSGYSYVSMRILLCDLCESCIWFPLFLHGHCFCEMDSYCNGNTSIEQSLPLDNFND